jgi:pimeloyl-ACP methyl ester carboxylesterase
LSKPSPTFYLLHLIFGLLWASRALAEPSFVEQNAWVASRGVEIPVTLVKAEPGAIATPLVVLAHGHGGSRDEGGGFRRLAALLASAGIASVRMDFPGCGESLEAFSANTIDHMLSDIAAARDFALGQRSIDAGKVGLLGFSMGGRLAMLSLAGSFPYASLALWAPAASDGPADFYSFLGGPEQYLDYRAEAAEQGSVIITTPWGQQQQLSLAWFTGLEESQPLQTVSSFSGPVLVLHGTADEIIPASHSAPIIQELPQAERQLVEGAEHGLGFYNDDPDSAALILQQTTRFFVQTLLPR